MSTAILQLDSVVNAYHDITFLYRLNFDEEPIFQVENVDSSPRQSTETIPELLEISSDDFQVATQSFFDEFMLEIEVNVCTTTVPVHSEYFLLVIFRRRTTSTS